LILLNPGQVHENGAVDDSGFALRTLYLPAPLAERYFQDAGLQTLGGYPVGIHLKIDATGFTLEFVGVRGRQSVRTAP
jgi:hypothetical protein